MKEPLAKISIVGALVCGPLALVLGGFLMFSGSHTPAPGAFNPTGGNTYLLQSSISSSQNTITLTSFTEPGSGIPYTMTYLNSDIEYGTINPSSGNSEFVSFSGITQNTNGTATLTGVIRGESRTPGTGGCVASTTLAHAYPGQTQFILSNSPCFYSEYAVKRNAQSITGIWTYASTSPPRYDEVGAQSGGSYIATTSEFASVAYVNATAFAGASNASETVKGIVQLATNLQAASSTPNGSTAARLVIPASMATSTPGTAGLWAVITNNAGKIAQGFIDFTTANTWSGLQTFSAGFIDTASSTFTSSPTFSTIKSSLLKTNTSGQLTAAVEGTDFAGPAWSYGTTTATSTGGISVTNGSKSISSAPITILTFPSGTLTASSSLEVDVIGNCVVGTISSATAVCGATLQTNTGAVLWSITGAIDTNGNRTDNYGYHVATISTSTANEVTTNVGNGVAVNSAVQSSFVDLSTVTSLQLIINGSVAAGSGESAVLTSAGINGYTVILRP